MAVAKDAAVYADRAGAAFDAAGAARLAAVIGLPALAMMAVVGVHAAFELRPLSADGFHYFNRILETEAPMLPSPGRRFSEWLPQIPLLVGMKLGLRNLETLGILYGLALQLLPIGATALCWAVLPRERKHFFVFPLVHLFAGSMGTSFSAIASGATAAALFWLLFFLLLFRANRPLTMIVTGLLSLLTIALHESMIFLGPILALVSLWRARREPERIGRIGFALLAVWFMVVAMAQAWFILDPVYPNHGRNFLRALVAADWMSGPWPHFNVPAVVGLGALVLMALLAVQPLQAGRGVRLIGSVAIVFFSLAAFGFLAFAAMSDRMLGVDGQFAARNHPVLISFPLALAAFLLSVRPRAIGSLAVRRAVVLCAVLAGTAAVWHVNATHQWSRYVAAFRGILETNSGFVDWDAALEQMPEDRRRLLRVLTHTWTVLPMSIALAPEGQVKTIVGHTSKSVWKPFDPRDPDRLPRSRFWDSTAYRMALAEQELAQDAAEEWP